MEDLIIALTESIIGTMVTMMLLGILGSAFYLIGKYETSHSTSNQDEPYVIAAAYHYLSCSHPNQLKRDDSLANP